MAHKRQCATPPVAGPSETAEIGQNDVAANVARIQVLGDVVNAENVAGRVVPRYQGGDASVCSTFAGMHHVVMGPSAYLAGSLLIWSIVVWIASTVISAAEVVFGLK